MISIFDTRLTIWWENKVKKVDPNAQLVPIL